MGKLGTMLQAGRAFGVRDGVLRLEYELRRGSGLLSWKMRSLEGWNSWELNRIAPVTSPEELLNARRNGARKFFFHDVRDLQACLKEIAGDGREQTIVAEAERILAGQLPFFGRLTYSCGFPPRWFQNPVTGQSVPPQKSWTELRFASTAHSDLKFILEPSRFLFAYSLVRAYALTADERFPQAFWRALEHWAQHSPPMSGPLWICGQECSLRILAWSFALRGFIHSPSTTPARVAKLVSMIAAHAWRTAQTLGYARSQRSNHLITEAVGLWTTGVLYPELRESQLWQNLGAQLLHEAVLDQITPSGISHQHSFNYQRMILCLLLWTLRLAEIQHAELHPDILSRTQAAFDFLRSWVDPVSGCAPNYGANDGSLILPLAAAQYEDFRPLLQLGAAVLNRPALPPGSWDEPGLWFGVQPKPAHEAETPCPSPDTGYFRLGNEHSWALIRAGQYTRRPYQADQLHVDLWWNGINLACDPGTYLYNGPAPWNNAFARTAVHNTVTVDHHDQMRRAGRFLWLDWAQASGKLSSSSNDSAIDCFEGEHDGYKRLRVRHRRMLQWLAGVGWVIVDDLEGEGEHDLRLHWLVPDLPFEVRDSAFQVEFTARQSKIRWNMFCSASAASSVVRAGTPMETSPLVAQGPRASIENHDLCGWHASTYGDLQPAVSLICQARSCLPVRFLTAILTDEQCAIESTNDEVTIIYSGLSKTGHAEASPSQHKIFRLSLAPKSAARRINSQPVPAQPA
jgi:hypothetical protein